MKKFLVTAFGIDAPAGKNLVMPHIVSASTPKSAEKKFRAWASRATRWREDYPVIVETFTLTKDRELESAVWSAYLHLHFAYQHNQAGITRALSWYLAAKNFRDSICDITIQTCTED